MRDDDEPIAQPYRPELGQHSAAALTLETLVELATAIDALWRLQRIDRPAQTEQGLGLGQQAGTDDERAAVRPKQALLASPAKQRRRPREAPRRAVLVCHRCA